MSDIQNINISEETRTINLFENLTKKQKYTSEEIRQASLYRDYLASSGANAELSNFLDKALKNNMADEIREQQERENKEEYEDRKRSLIYVD